jgi:hypothetical protein
MMGLIDHPLTPLIVNWHDAVVKSDAYRTHENRTAEAVARALLNVALEESK